MERAARPTQLSSMDVQPRRLSAARPSREGAMRLSWSEDTAAFSRQSAWPQLGCSKHDEIFFRDSANAATHDPCGARDPAKALTAALPRAPHRSFFSGPSKLNRAGVIVK